MKPKSFQQIKKNKGDKTKSFKSYLVLLENTYCI